MLLLNINRKPYMGSPVALSHLTLSDLERSISRSLRYHQRLISRKAAELGRMLLLNINRTSHTCGDSKTTITFGLEHVE